MNTQEWLSKLIAIDTTSAKSNLALIQIVAEWCEFYQVETRLTYSENRQKANLWATLRTNKGDYQNGLILSGHTDVVPVQGQNWSTDPFKATLKKDRIYGRGACDMKGFLAVILALIPELKQQRFTKPVHFAFSYDEEIGCLGVSKLIADFQQQGISPAACIVGEPTEMHPVLAHKGIQVFKCKIKGLAAHSSFAGCNAIEYGAQLIAYIRILGNKIKIEANDPDFTVPYTTLSTNLINGGNAINIIPAETEFIFEIRNLPGLDPDSVILQIKQFIQDQLLPEMRKEYEQANIELIPIANVPGSELDAENSLAKLVKAVTQTPFARKLAYATEAGIFQAAGIPTLICGPGNIEQAHQANEFVTVQQLQACEVFVREIIQAWMKVN